MTGALDGMLVVTMEQAVAAPYCSSRLADAGARVIKVERPEGDFARAYDRQIKGMSAFFVWLNRGKESLVCDIKDPDDNALLRRILAKADVFIQNLAPGAADRAGLGAEAMRAANPGLVTVDISGYGSKGPYAQMKAYDFLVQGESGITSVTGTPDAMGRVGVSICDIAAGMYSQIAVLEALFEAKPDGGRQRDRGLYVRGHGGMDVPASPPGRLRHPWAAAGRPPPPDDRALRRLPLRGRRSGDDRDPEPAGMAAVLRRGLGK